MAYKRFANKYSMAMKKKILNLMYHLSVGNINYEYASKQVLDLFAVSGAKRKVCPVCKKTFEKGWGEFCSQDCFLAFFLKK